MNLFIKRLFMGSSVEQNDGYVALAIEVSPYVAIYRRENLTFTRLPNPADLPQGLSRGVAFSPSGQFLAVVGDSAATEKLTIYSRSRDAFDKIAIPSEVSAIAGQGLAFSPDGTYLAIAADASPFVKVLKANGGSFELLPDPPTLATSNTTGQEIAWSPDGSVLAIGGNPDHIYLYGRNDDAFFELAGEPNASAGNAGGAIAFNPTGDYLGVGAELSPRLTVYQNTSGVSWNAISVSPSPSFEITSLSFNSFNLAAATNNAELWYQSGSTWIRNASTAASPSKVALSKDGKALYVATIGGTDKFYVAPITGTASTATFGSLITPTPQPEGRCWGVAQWPMASPGSK